MAAYGRAVAHFDAMSMPLPDPLENLDADALRALLREREQQLARAQQRLSDHEQQSVQRERLITLKDTTIAKLTHEIAVLRRFRFGKKSEQVSGVQGSLLEEAVAAASSSALVKTWPKSWTTFQAWRALSATSAANGLAANARHLPKPQ